MNGHITGWLIGGWLLTAVVAFYSGMRTEAGKIERLAERQVKERAELVDSPSRWFTPDTEEEAALQAGDGLPENMQSGPNTIGADSIENILSNEDYLSRSQQLAELLQNLGPENIGEAKAIFAKLLQEDGLPNRREIEMFLYAWARFDPQSAMEFVQENAEGRGGMWLAASVVQEWASSDKEGALRWIVGQENEDARRGALFMMLRMESMRDPEAAIQTLGMIPSDQVDGRMARSVAQRYAESNPQAALAWANGLQDDDLRIQIMDDVVEGWARQDPQAAASWLESRLDEPYAAASVSEVVEVMADNDPTAAAKWLSSLPEGPPQQRGMIELIREWSESDPAAAGQYLNQLPEGQVSDPAVNAYARNVAREDISSSMDWAVTIVDDGQRRNAIVDIGRYWYSRNPDEAMAYFTKNQLPEDTIQSISQVSGRVRPPWRRGR